MQKEQKEDKNAAPEAQPVQDDDSFQFVQERIKERPINKKKLLRRTIITAVSALLFGSIACVAFFSLQPIISNWLYPEKKPRIVVFPADDEETMPGDMVQTDYDLPGMSANGDPDAVTVYEKVEMSVQDYTLLYSRLSAIAAETQKSMVTVTGVTSDSDWFNDLYEKEGQSSGLIVADNGIELLVLATEARIRGYRKVLVTFYNGNTVEAEKKQSDPNTGLCILAVAKEKLTDTTRENALPAALGYSNNAALLGSPIIAIGAPMGNVGSVCYGMITANTSMINLVDVNYRLLTTDIYGSTQATGVIINLSGQVIGIIGNVNQTSDIRNQISAIGITDLKKTIEVMSNEKVCACLGIRGVDVTASLSESLHMPRGVYVQRFDIGSPAMIYGIQGNDIITAIDDAEIRSMRDLTETLYQYSPDDSVTVTLYRKSQDKYRQMEIRVVLGKLK